MRRMRSMLLVFLLSLTWLFLVDSGSRLAAAEDTYYMIVFSNQRVANLVRFSHTFAAFVKCSGATPTSPGRVTEIHTISWMPASLNIAVLRARPEPGVLYDLESSLNWAYLINSRLSMWGPYQIQKELYDRAVEQEKRLSAGAMLYKTIDARFRPGVALNCIHAVSDIDTDEGYLQVGTARGDAASYGVAQHLKRWIIQPERTHPWVSNELGLDGYPIVLRDLP